MEFIRTKLKLKQYVKEYREKHPNGTIGFVPTMGFLHRGHLSLMQTARSENDRVIVSIFVNPTQFGPTEDFEQYPRDENRDAELCRQTGADIIFTPDCSQIYPPGYFTYVSVKALTDSLCGKYRPGHFDGVTTVVAKLFNIVTPDRAYFGQKDGQQALVIRRMTEDLDFGIEIRVLPTVREPDGLAMSSRNVFLSPEGRLSATRIFAGLENAQQLYRDGQRKSDILMESIRRIVSETPDIAIQYLECRDLDSLEPVTDIRRPVIIAIACFLESVRLIDNIILGDGGTANDQTG